MGLLRFLQSASKRWCNQTLKATFSRDQSPKNSRLKNTKKIETTSFAWAIRRHFCKIMKIDLAQKKICFWFHLRKVTNA